tara:strand:- start:16652 stop:17101 length:450 start_codon:yes stop_codon:yes gene_type:complete
VPSPFVTTIFAIVLCALLAPGIGASEELVIHRCAQDDGTIAFQEMPCAEPTEESGAVAESPPAKEIGVASDSVFDFVNPFDAEAEPLLQAEQEPSAPPSQDRAECEKKTRDAIDAIDAELQHSTSQADDRKHLAELLQLTRQLRACKAL